MMRFIKYCAFALIACCSVSAFAGVLERPVLYFARVLDSVGDMYGATSARMELTLAQWRTGSEPSSDALKSNLRASSNHFEMVSARPKPESYGLSTC